MTPKELRNGLAGFYGTDGYHVIHPYVKLTDGAKFLAQGAGCFWLMDIIASIAPMLRKKDYFTSIKLRLDGKGGAVFTADDGNGHILYRQKIEYTDFPLTEGIDLFFIDDVVMLTSEY